mmetsp:Transcript_1425/g.2017  ORF Transcript_1425/g.2017 Transcript_1425/m.2017 type:complete len:593 (+) Transcript_1425:100-1878(+)|eukprot:CAMPEP_0167770000 /NCGR_PEP_ID=MMETSP0110_2-20121227/17653_1 /TAXON_ID=629695 /ORGANISM="Gymnochlora sp., Strain CCMP2014" /LENGTH=592 /DNA_ID=CAMNT_0007659083 /DNA_START=53 /DNA_END=1831 /DNA_ORIENTATION=-
MTSALLRGLVGLGRSRIRLSGSNSLLARQYRPTKPVRCGILAIFDSSLNTDQLRKQTLECSKLLRHRGPDWNGIVLEGPHAIAHERLAIVDPESGEQPLISQDENIILSVNGEIYNYKELQAELKTPYNFRTNSDCEVIIPLYQEHGIDFIKKLRGMFSFVLYDKKQNRYIAVRDHMGITPMYMGYGQDGSVIFSSELKGLIHVSQEFKAFPPGHYYDSNDQSLHQWYQPSWADGRVTDTALDLPKVKAAFETAVQRRMMADVPWGVLLSGGLDSSLVASIAKRKVERGEMKSVMNEVHSFSIGLEGSPDLAAAKKVADFLGTEHHNYTFTVQDGIDAIEEVIYHLETYDVTTIRASTPMFLMSRKIKSIGIKMVLSGEGADEVFGGYLYFHKAPNREEFHHECVRKLQALHLFDCLRANKATSAWGIEARVPFLDQDFLELAMNIDAKEKMIDMPSGRIEKWIMRAAFDDEKDPYLPREVLYRQKEQFSDGVGYSWIDGLKEYAENMVNDQQMQHAKFRFPHNTPQTKEAYLYRSIFDSHFPDPAQLTVPGGPSIACSTAAAIEWDKSFKNNADPSGRAIAGVHTDAYNPN